MSLTINRQTLKAIIERRADARTADQRVIERRRKPRQTRAQFLQHVQDYCARRGQR